MGVPHRLPIFKASQFAFQKHPVHTLETPAVFRPQVKERSNFE